MGVDPLAGLDNVPWDELDFAAPSEVPGLLFGVAYGDERERDECITHLYEQIWHQGTVYRITPPAVPFVARLARDTALDLEAMSRASLVLRRGGISRTTP